MSLALFGRSLPGRATSTTVDLARSLKASISYRVLEPRTAFDAALVVTAAEAIKDQVAAERSATEGAQHEAAAGDASHAALSIALIDAAVPKTSNSVVFVDTSVSDYQQLLTDVPAGSDVVLIDGNKDGLHQIAKYLAGRSGIESVHILSHGSEANLYVGTSDLNVESMQTTYAADLATIKRSLATGADLLVYGCNFAKGADGAAAAETLSRLTGADVAASTNLTGDAAQGGDWNLELHTGNITSKIAVGIDAAAKFHHTLDVSLNNGKGALLSVHGNVIYSIDIATGKGTPITTVPSSIGGVAFSGSVNSLAVDQANDLIYYCDNATVATNKALFAYNFVTNTHILVESDLTSKGVTLLAGGEGVGGSGATFGNGKLYLGVEFNQADGSSSILSLIHI